MTLITGFGYETYYDSSSNIYTGLDSDIYSENEYEFANYSTTYDITAKLEGVGSSNRITWKTKGSSTSSSSTSNYYDYVYISNLKVVITQE